ncbi:MAG: hypothetical protein AAGH15_16105, partial [Myxococcota bacterium]
MRRSLLCLAALGTLLGCRSDPVIVVPPTFERPGAIAFVCVAGEEPERTDPDAQIQRIVPFENCRGLRGVEDESFAVNLLVAQTARGEIGTVNLRRNEVLDLDRRVPGFTFRRVGEGPTGIALRLTEGAAGDADLATTYVASFGARSVSYLPTRSFNRSVSTPGAGPGERTLEGGPVDLEVFELDPSGPDDAVTGVLVAAVPERGELAIYTLDPSGTPSDAPLTLGLATPADVAPLAIVDAEGNPIVSVGAYRRACRDGQDARALVRDPDVARAVAETEVVPLGETSAPTQLLVVELGANDAGEASRQLWVADAALPLVHRLSFDDDGVPTELPPIRTGTPVRALAISPLVPATIPERALDLPTPAEDEERLYPADSMVPMERFLYAIDATDGSVMVVDATNPGSPTFGAVLPVSTREDVPANRLTLRSAADAITVVVNDALVTTGTDDFANAVGTVFDEGVFIDRSRTGAIVTALEASDPAFDLLWCGTPETLSAPGPDASAEEIAAFEAASGSNALVLDERRRGTADDPAPPNLRGVFLVAALATGEIQVIDVHDLDATCRGGTFVDGALSCAQDENDAVRDEDAFAYVERHRPRVGSFLPTDIQLTATPAITFGSSAGSVSESGEGVATDGIRLVALQDVAAGMPPELSCPNAAMVPVFPDEEDLEQDESIGPRICATVSPWDRRTEAWLAEWR